MLAQPASATTDLNGCSVNPLAPVFAGRNGAGVKIVRYNAVISCTANRSVEVQQMFFEQDTAPDPDDFTGTRVITVPLVNAGITTKGVTLTVPNTDPGAERLYQRTRFRVTNGASVSPWTAFESSGVLSITN